MKTKAHHDKLRDQGEADFKAGKPIDAFELLPLKRHTELERGSYENGWRAAKEESYRQYQEGWTWLINSRKWHFFTSKDGRSLCGKFLLFRLPDDLEPDDSKSPDDCAGCRRALDKRSANDGGTKP